MHDQFMELLKTFEVKPALINPLKQQLKLTFEYMNQSIENDKNDFGKRQNAVKEKIENVEEKFVEGDIDKEIFQKFKQKYESQLTELITESQNPSEKLSNPENFINYSLSLSQNLSKIWSSSDLDNKLRFQKMVFPEGLGYDRQKSSYRTQRINNVLLRIVDLSRVSGENKKGNSSLKKMNSPSVPGKGIEPPLCYHNQILSLARLPIPPPGLIGGAKIVGKISQASSIGLFLNYIEEFLSKYFNQVFLVTDFPQIESNNYYVINRSSTVFKQETKTYLRRPKK